MVDVITRIAPTPSGYLHEGNRVNFRLTADLAAALGADLALRIDDADATRYRSEYVEDIFRTLVDMGIAWQRGPRDREDFEQHWSQRLRTERYRAEVAAAGQRGLQLYACDCSRTRQRGPATGGCSGGCRTRRLDSRPGATALRVAVPVGTVIDVDGHRVDLASEMGDFVLWRRDDLPAYQLVSVVEDRDLGTTHIVRGRDLLASSAAQIWLAPALGAGNVASAVYLHHDLVTDGAGAKLSKSTLGSAVGEPDGRQA